MLKKKVMILMGSDSDLSTMMEAIKKLKELGVEFEVEFEVEIVSAHRTPSEMAAFALAAYGRGVRIVIAGAGGSAHLPGMLSAFSRYCVIFGVPCPSAVHPLYDVAAVMSMAFMPAGIPLATFSLGGPGAVNAAIEAAKILAFNDEAVHAALVRHFDGQVEKVAAQNRTLKVKILELMAA